jgi:hypothetical protein
MKNYLQSLCFYVIFLSVTCISFAQVTPLNLPETFDNSIPLPRTAEEGFNMYTDNTLTLLKPVHTDKINFVKDYMKRVNDYMLQTAEEVKTAAINNDAVLQDTSMEGINRRIKALNDEMTEIITNEVGELGTAQAEFAGQISSVQDNREKMNRLNSYISGKYAEIFNRYCAALREKLVSIYGLYQEVNFGASMRNPVSRITAIASLYATLGAFVNHKNDIVKGTAERLAIDYLAYKN